MEVGDLCVCMCVFERAWTIDVELYAFHSTESWTGVLGGKDELVWICMCVSVREKTVRIQLWSRWSAQVIRHLSPQPRSFHLTSRCFTWLSKDGKICKCTNKFPGWGKQRGRERCVSGEVAGLSGVICEESAELFIWIQPGSPEKTLIRMRCEAWRERMNESRRDWGGWGRLWGGGAGWERKRERRGGVEDEAVLIINVLNSPVMPQK